MATELLTLGLLIDFLHTNKTITEEQYTMLKTAITNQIPPDAPSTTPPDNEIW
jgi:hypothetical protein